MDHVAEFDIYDERLFYQSLTFNTYVPILIADIIALRRFEELYKRPARLKYMIRRKCGPLFFGSRPINYVKLVAYCSRVEVIYGTPKVIFCSEYERKHQIKIIIIIIINKQFLILKKY